MDVTKRFSDRVANYIKYRPSYPTGVVDYILDATHAETTLHVADIGSGTGIFSRLMLDRSCYVYGVEPNREMRLAAERLLSSYDHFTSIDGTAEATGLQVRTADVAVAAQAFHWFDKARARNEWKRILRPNGTAALIWNDRRVDSSLFLEEYDNVLRTLGTDYEQVNHRNVGESELAAFFGGPYKTAVFYNNQQFDWDGLYGRAMSSSYVPGEGHEGHLEFTAALRSVFEKYEQGGFVYFDYDCRIYLGELL